MKKVKFLTLLISFFYIQFVDAQTTIIIPGTYCQGLILGYDSITGMVTGFYEDAAGYNEITNLPKFVCSFFFIGKIDKYTNEIICSTPGEKGKAKITGKILPLQNNVLRIKLSEAPNGCLNVDPNFITSGAEFTLEKKEPWHAVRIVSVPIAPLFDAPNEKNKTLKIVVKGEIVNVLEIKGSWLKIEHAKRRGELSGWIKESDLY